MCRGGNVGLRPGINVMQSSRLEVGYSDTLCMKRDIPDDSGAQEILRAS